MEHLWDCVREALTKLMSMGLVPENRGIFTSQTFLRMRNYIIVYPIAQSSKGILKVMENKKIPNFQPFLQNFESFLLFENRYLDYEHIIVKAISNCHNGDW
jgi:hypothetical protein